VKRTVDVRNEITRFSDVRFTDCANVTAIPSDKSLGYFQSSAKSGLGGDFVSAQRGSAVIFLLVNEEDR
jgi:hypothetical protein